MTLTTGKTQLLGVIGHPVEHSLSPVMHNAALQSLGLDWLYVPFKVAPAQLSQAISGLAALGERGFNVTLPHKQTIMSYLPSVSTLARQVGAVNTVIGTDSGWHGTNTDVEGFLAPLQSLKQDWSESAPVILGNGGAARAVVVALAQLGCSTITVVGRDPAKLACFHRSWSESDLNTTLRVCPWEQLPGLLPSSQLLVNTTPVGMAPHAELSPLEPHLWPLLSSTAIAYDLIYNPRPTRFLQLAQAQGAIALDGLPMLVHQGAAALRMWLNQAVPVATMMAALQKYPHSSS